MEKLLSAADLEKMGIARSAVYALFGRDDFPTVHIGRRLFVTESALCAWFEKGGTAQDKAEAK